MNEELKIVIRAVTTDAKKNLADVKKELANIEGEGNKTKKTLGETMKSVAKGAAAAMATVAALTAAIVSLGKAAVDAQKGIAKLNTAFETNGSNAKQAGETYKQLFGFLGDSDKAVEAAQSLALITTNKDELQEYGQILKGVFASMGDKLPVEGLAEAINATIQKGEVDGVFADAIEWMGISLEGFNQKLAQTATLEEREALVRNTLNGLYRGSATLYDRNNQATIQYNQSQANLNLTLAQATRYTTPLMTALNNLSATLLTFFGPALQTVSIYLTAFIQLIAEAIRWVGSFFGMFSGSTQKASADVEGYQAAMNKYISSLQGTFGSANEEIKDTNKGIQELKKQTMGFDELNIVSKPTASPATGGGGGGGGGVPLGKIPVAPNPADYGIGMTDFGFEDMKKDIEEAKSKIKGILTLVAAVAAAFGLWKLINFIKDLTSTLSIMKTLKGVDLDANWNSLNEEQTQAVLHSEKLKTQFKNLGGTLMIAAGAILLLKGYSDAWVNGIDWGNFAMILAGIGLTVGGIALIFGPVAAGVALIVGGITALVIGIKDFITNGYSMQNVLMILAGVIAIVVGVCLAFNAALLANPITWIIIGIAALVAAFVILWNECEGFRNFWIGLWEKAKALFAQFVDSIRPLIDAIVFAFKQAWELIKVVWMDYLVPMFKFAWELIKGVWNAVKPYFQLIWDNIKLIFSIVGDVLSGYFKVAWEMIKAVWDIVVSYFTTIITNIGLAFGVVKDLLSGNFSAAWEKIKQIFSNVGSFFGGVIDTIKNTFKNIATIVGDTISSVVKKAINGVLSTAVKIINGFISAINTAISVINAIPGVSIKKLNKLEVPKLATGGILTRESLFVGGEGGKKEAVLPLEQNTEWMDILADRIAGRTAAPSKLVLMVDGKELGWASIHGINGITKQTGTLPLELALV
jgi:phage-related protein